MEKVIYNLVFNRKKQLNTEGKALIQVEAYLNRQKRYFSTKVYVKPCQWDNKRRSIKNHPNMDALNLYLQNYVMELERDELEKRQANNGFSLKDLREETSSISTSSSFLVFMREEILHSIIGNTKSTRFIPYNIDKQQITCWSTRNKKYTLLHICFTSNRKKIGIHLKLFHIQPLFTLFYPLNINFYLKGLK